MENKKIKVAKNNSQNGISRRGFIKGAGITAAGTVIAGSGILKGSGQTLETNKMIGPNPVNISLNVNGKIRWLTVEPRATLADALRDELQLTGTKVSCDRGSCSACTVWLDDTPVLACMTLAVEVRNREVTTIEGLAKDGKLHPVQEAFIEHDASQCGFCTPGMIMTTAHLVDHNTNLTEEDVKETIRGNLCRCGTHPKVFAATLDASKKN
jgi:xanthine dehydrogenase YagT iron-sulfur-binding subunit